MKKCVKCGVEQGLDNFYLKPDMADGHANVCNSCKVVMQREYRLKNGNVVTHKYEKTKSGFLVRLYRNMLSRVSGVQKEKHYLYEGLTILPKDSFYEWANADKRFHELFEAWQQSGFSRRICPSVDRINSRLGYELDNMEWVTLSVNCARGAMSRKVNGVRKPKTA